MQTTLTVVDVLIDLRDIASSNGRDDKSSKERKESGKGDKNNSPKTSKKKWRAIAMTEQGKSKEGEVKPWYGCFLCSYSTAT